MHLPRYSSSFSPEFLPQSLQSSAIAPLVDPIKAQELPAQTFQGSSLLATEAALLAHSTPSSLTVEAGAATLGIDYRTGAPLQLLFIDTGIANYQQLAAAANPDQQVILLDSSQDGILQISQVLAQYENLAAVHIVSHGASGSLNLGTSNLNLESLQGQYQDAIAGWARAFSADGDLLVYGCDLASGEQGAAFIADLSALTGADVAASTDLTGNAALGGDWTLEVQTGAIESGLAFEVSGLSAYAGVLFTFRGTAAADQIRVQAAGPTGAVTISSLNNTFASITYTPTTREELVIESGGGADTITLEMGAFFFSPITITDPDDVILGNVTMEGSNLTVNAGNSIRLLDSAVITNRSGNVNLNVTDTVELDATSVLLRQRQSNAAIDLGNGSVTANNISISTEATTTKSSILRNNLVYNTTATLIQDVNGDRRADLIVGSADGPVQIYLNNGTLNPFGGVNAINLAGSTGATSLSVGDLNRDGRADLVVGRDREASLVFFNTGTELPFSAIGQTLEAGVSTVALGDLNNDGQLDIVLGRSNQPTLPFRVYYTTPGLLTSDDPPLPSSINSVTALALVDANQDGRLDIVAGTNQGTQLFLNTLGRPGLISSFRGSFASGIRLDAATDRTSAIAVGDVNGDGRADLILGRYDRPTQILFNTTLTNPTLASPFVNSQIVSTPVAGDQVRSVALADVNNDGRLDLLVGSTTQPLSLFLNSGASATPFLNPVTRAAILIDPGSAANASVLAVGDLNNDGRPDVAIGSPGQVPAIYFQNGPTSATPPTPTNPFLNVAATLVTPESALATQVNESALFQFSLLAAGIQSSATATIRVGARSRLTATRNLTLLSTALSNAQNTTIGAYLGATYASSTPTATITLESNGTAGPTLQAGGLVTINSTVSNTVAVSTSVYNLATALSQLGGLSGGFAGDVTFSYAKGISTSRTDIQRGTTITATEANIDARNLNSFSNTASATGVQASGPIGFGAAVVISDFQSNATTSMHGTLTTTGNAAIAAASINRQNVTRASASSSGPKQTDPGTAGKAIRGAGPTLTRFGNFLSSQGSKFSINGLIKVGQSAQRGGGRVQNFTNGADVDGVNLQLSAAVSVANTRNNATAFVGAGARVSAPGNVTIGALAQDNPQSSASVSGQAEQRSISAGVTVANFGNKASAYIGTNATVDAGRTLTVNANAEIVRRFNLFALNLELPSGSPQTGEARPAIDTAWRDSSRTLDQLKAIFVDGLYGGIISTGTDLGIAATTLAQSGASVAQGGQFGLAGGVSVLTIDNGSSAYIGEGAQVNQTASLATADQDVKVNAFAGITTLNIAGQANVLNISDAGGGVSGGTALGGSVNVITLQNEALSYIADLARVTAKRDLEVKSDTFVYGIVLAQAGSKAEKYGVTGAVNFVTIDNQSTAYVEDQAIVKADRDLSVLAKDSLFEVNGTGNLGRGANVGVGISGGINKINTTVRAFIGNNRAPDTSSSTLGSVVVGRNLTVDATSDQKVITLSLAGAVAEGYKTPGGVELLRDSTGQLFEQEVQAQRQFGFGLSGAASITLMTPNVQAYIGTGAGSIIVNNQLTVNASNTTLLVTPAGAWAAAKDVGIGGAFAFNYLDKTTLALIDSTPRVSTGSLVVTATAVSPIVSVAAGAAGAKGNASVAGSVNLNILNTNTQAYLGSLRDVTIASDDGGLTIAANNTLTTWSIAGAVSAAAGARAAVGAALDIGVIDTTVRSYIGSGSTVTYALRNPFQILASNTQNLRSIGAAFALAAQSGVGASGSTSAQSITTEVEAGIRSGAQVFAGGNLRIDADDNVSLLGIGGAAAGGQTAGVGLSLALSNLSRSVKAGIEAGAIVSALGRGVALADPQGRQPATTGIAIDANSTDTRLLFAAGVGGSTGTAGVAASSVVNVIKGAGTQALIGAGATVNRSIVGAEATQSVAVRANHTTNILSVAGSFAGAQQVGVGAAADVEVITKNVSAYIDSTAAQPTTVNAANNIVVEATSRDTMLNISAGVGVATQVVGIAGSATVLTLNTNTLAYTGANARLAANGSIGINAYREANMKTIAGAAGFGGQGGVGAANSTIVATDIIRAFAGANNTLVAQGNGSGVNVPNSFRNTAGSPPPLTLNGLAITAANFTDLLTIAVGGAGGGAAGIAGSATVNVLDETTQAYLNTGTTLNAATPASSSTLADVFIRAVDDTKIISSAGAIGVGVSAVGIGAGADVGTIKKNTQAYIGANAQVQAANVLIDAFSREDFLSVAVNAGISPGGFAGIAGGASVYMLNTKTYAYIGNQSTVRSFNNIRTLADDTTKMTLLTGTLSFSGQGAGVGAAAGVSVLDKDTQAYVGRGAVVNALANGPTVGLGFNGRFNIRFDDYGTSPGDVRASGITNADAIGNASPSLFKQRLASPAGGSYRGLSVSALNRDSIEHLAVGGSAAGAAALQVAGSVNVTRTNTRAAIEDQAQVNQEAGAASTQQVLVNAGNDFYHLGIGGSGAASLVGAFAPGAGVALVTNVTTAAIGASARVNGRNIAVTANAAEDISSITAAAGVAGIGAVAGAVSVITVNNTTQATISNSATVNSDGNLLLSANDDTTTSIIAGSAAIGFKGGIGGSVGNTQITKNTTATIGVDAVVNAKGNWAGFLTAIDGNGALGDATTGFATKQIRGLAVQATSSETLFTAAVAGAGGFFGGLAGSVSVGIVKSDTLAAIGGNARINQDVTGTAADQSVNVSGVNRVKLFAAAGSIAGGGVGLAGGVDVGVIENRARGTIGASTRINARQDVEVNGLMKQKLDSYAASGAAGAVGIAGSVSVYTIGSAALSTDALSSLRAKDANNPTTTWGYVDSQSTVAPIATALGSYRITGSDSNQRVSNAATNAGVSYTAALPTSRVAAELTGSGGSGVGSASVTTGLGSIISAGRNLNLNARERVDLNQTSGTGVAGALAIGGSVVVGTISDQASLETQGSLSAVGDINLTADFNDKLTGRAYAGSGGLVGLGAQVVIYTDNANSSNRVGSSIGQAKNVQIRANNTRVIDPQSIGGTIGGVVAGASIARATVTGNTTAALLTSLGQAPGLTVNNLTIQATTTTTATPTARAVAAGVLSGSGAETVATLTPSGLTVLAFVDPGVNVRVANDVTVDASANETATAQSTGVNIAGGTAGVSLARTTIKPSVSSYLGAGSIVNAGGNVTVQAQGRASGSADTVASGGGVIAGSGSDSQADATPVIFAFTGNSSQVTAGGTFNLIANGLAPTDASANKRQVVGLLGSFGRATAAATATPEVTAQIGAGSIIGAKDINLSTNTTVSDGNTVFIGNTVFANAVAPSRVSASATARSTPTYRVLVGDRAQLRTQTSLALNALNNSGVDTAAATGAVGIFEPTGQVAAIGALTPTALVRLGTNVLLNSGGSMSLTSRTFPVLSNQIAGGGLFGAGRTRTNSLQNSATLRSGTGLQLSARTLNLTANTQTNSDPAPNPNTNDNTIDPVLSAFTRTIPRG
jgi:hypothetical protein